MTKQDKLNAALEMLSNRLQKSEKFVLSEAPHICREIVNREIRLSLYWIATSSMILYISMMSASRLYLTYLSHESLMFVWPTMLAVISAVGCLSSCENLISVATAPKLTILECIKALLLGNKE